MSEDLKGRYWECYFCGTKNEWKDVICSRCGTINMSMHDEKKT